MGGRGLDRCDLGVLHKVLGFKHQLLIYETKETLKFRSRGRLIIK